MGTLPISAKTQTRLAHVLRAKELPKHVPHRFLVGKTWESPETGLHGVVNDFIKAELMAARAHLNLEGADLMTAVLGPSTFGEIPLGDFLEQGFVFGLDIDLQAMERARGALPEGARDRLIPLQVEASLVANELIEATMAALDKHSVWTEEAFADLHQVWNGVEVTRQLPFSNSSLHMVISISFIEAAMAEMINAAVGQYIWPKFGQEASFRFLSEVISYQKEEVPRGMLLQRANNSLYRKLVKAQLRDAQQILKEGGVAFLSSHMFRFESWRFGAGHFRVSSEEMFAADQYFYDLSISPAGKLLDVEIGKRAEGVQVLGEDSLAELAKGVEGFKVLDDFNFWGVNRLGHPHLGSAIYQLDSALVLQKAS